MVTPVTREARAQAGRKTTKKPSPRYHTGAVRGAVDAIPCFFFVNVNISVTADSPAMDFKSRFAIEDQRCDEYAFIGANMRGVCSIASAPPGATATSY